jgi:alpha-tubulin suppressor-like RCC1 family protein
VHASGSTFRAISAGTSHSCAIDSTGQAWCWGRNNAGQLGDSTGTENHPFPVQVSGLNNAIAISAGSLHSCAIDATGQAWCWGGGFLGNGTNTTSYVPVPVSGLSNATAISAGYEHTCAIDSTGQAWCWGHNWNGQLGDGTQINSSIPVPVSGLSNATAISVGREAAYTCAIDGTGQTWCWGHNHIGQLGDGTTTDSNIPVQVRGLNNATTLSAGITHTCAIDTTDQAWCWGPNYHGKLGDGTTTDSNIPVQVRGFSNAIAIGTGFYHTCAIDGTGQAWCWGGNDGGMLGDGTTNSSSVPVPVNGFSNAVTISTVDSHTCAIDSTGQAWCWGHNWSGALGDGTITQYSNVPVQVQLPTLPPSFSEEPLNHRIRPGTSVNFRSMAGGGGGPYSYQWYRGESGDTSQPISGATERTFTTPPLSSDTAYWVRLSNPVGSTDSRTARISIKSAYDVALDGFSFINNYRYTPGRAIPGASWDIFKRTFPATTMELPGGTPRFGAARAFQSDDYQQIGTGSCAGFSAISMLRYLDMTESVERELLNPVYRRYTQIADLPPIVAGNVTVGRSNVKDYIFLYQGRQMSIQWQAWLSRHGQDTPVQTFEAVQQITQAGNVTLMAYGYSTPESEWQGHASVAYRTEQSGTTGFIYIYDPNWPGNATRRITVDLSANRWEYELWEGNTWSGTRHLFYVPANMLFPAALSLHEPRSAALATDDAGITIGIAGDVDLVITDPQGRQFGPTALEATQEISGAVRLINFSFNPDQPDATSPERYYLLAGQPYTVTVQVPPGAQQTLAATTPYTMTAFGDGSALTLSGTSLSGTQADTLILDHTIRNTNFTPAVDGDYCQALTDEISDEHSREYRTCIADGTGVTTRFRIADEDHTFGVTNSGTRPVTASLTTEQVGADAGTGTTSATIAPGSEVVAPPPASDQRIYLPLLLR